MHKDNLPSSPKKPKVLLYLFGSLGDTLVAIPALRAVRRHFKDAELILLQNVQTDNIVQASEVISKKLVDGYLSYKSQAGRFGKVFDFYHLWRKLRRQNFQAAVYLVISERPAASVLRDRLFFRFSGIRQLFGFHSFSKEELYPRDETGKPLMTESEAIRKLNRLKLDGVESSSEDLRLPFLVFSDAEIENIKNWLALRRKKPKARLISIAPGCKTPANAWDLENFIEIGHRLPAAENCELVIIGGENERAAGEKMCAAWGAGINSAGSLSVRESAALLSICDFHIGLDTGTTHLAAVVETRCFAIYGERNNPGHWYPAGEEHLIICHPVKCAGCRAEVCPIPSHPCMNEITVESVWNNLQNFMKDSPSDLKKSIQIITV